jgi:cobalt-precorrin-5B (C1)-methyltransferase
MRSALIVSHIGKLVKIGIGAFNTHYSFGDGRMETIAACALSAGADVAVLRKIMDCVMCDAALDVLREANLLEDTMSMLGGRINANLMRRVPEWFKVGFVCFTNIGNTVLARSENAYEHILPNLEV